MSEDRASEEIIKKIDQLFRRRNSLLTRLETLEKQNLPNLNTRNQAYRSVCIEGTRDNLREINQQIKEQQRNLSRLEDKLIDRLSASLNNLSVDKTRPERYKALETFINQSTEMFNTPPLSRPPVVHSPVNTMAANNNNNVSTAQTTEAAMPAVTTAASSEPLSDVAGISSTPKFNVKPSSLDTITTGMISAPIIQTHVRPRTYMRPPQGTYDLPPSYESLRDRADRLEQERILRDEFDYNMMMQKHIFSDRPDPMGTQFPKNTGAIPKSRPQIRNVSTNVISAPAVLPQIEENIIDVDVDDDFVSLIEQNPNQNIQNDSNDNLYNERMRHFIAYKATPERMANRPIQSLSSNESMRVHQNTPTYEREIYHPQPTVRFNIPPNSQQNNLDFQQDNMRSGNIPQQSGYF